jgi:hypothetical protein
MPKPLTPDPEDQHAKKRDQKITKRNAPTDNRSSVRLIAKLSKKLK